MQITRKTLIILAIFAAIFLISQWLFVPKTYVSSRILQALQAPQALLQALKSRHAVVNELSALALENQSLRAELEVAKNQPFIIQSSKAEYISARIYSSYPFNNASRLLVNAGSEQGIEAGDAALAAPGIFLGEVVSVMPGKSEIRTLFDPGWELPVKIGPTKIDSLLVGSHEPRLTLISKKKPVISGQTVILAAKNYPYGLTLGEVGDLKDSERDLFQEAELRTPYVISELNDVLIIK